MARSTVSLTLLVAALTCSLLAATINGEEETAAEEVFDDEQCVSYPRTTPNGGLDNAYVVNYTCAAGGGWSQVSGGEKWGMEGDGQGDEWGNGLGAQGELSGDRG